MKKIVKLTESELKNIVKASVRRSLKEGVITEGMLNENNIKKAAIKLAKAAGITVAAAMYFITVAMYGDDYEPATDPSAPGIEKSLKQMPDTISKDDKLNDYHIESSISNRLESRIRGAVMESIKSLMTENIIDPNDIITLANIVIKKYGHGNMIDTSNPEELIQNVQQVMRSEGCDEYEALVYMSGAKGGGWG